MKRLKLIIRIILMVICTEPFFALAAPPSAPVENQNVKLLKDSLVRLDTLVNSTKVCNNPLSISYAKNAVDVALKINEEDAKATAYKLMGIAYFQKHLDSSFFYYSMAMKIADDANLLKEKVHIFYNLATLYDAASDSKTALHLLDSSVRLAESIKDYTALSNAYNMIGSIKFNIQDYESSRQMFDSAFKIAVHDSLYKQMGAALSNIARFENDPVKSVSLLKEALGFLGKAKGTEEERANILINIGNRASSPDSALFYYRSALNLVSDSGLTKITIGAYNNMAYSYLEKGDIAMAESCLQDHAIPVALKDKDSDWLSSLYDTYADICIQKGDYKKAVEMQKKALQERIADDKQKASEQVRLLASLLDLKNKELVIQSERGRLQRFRLWLAISLLLVIASVFVILVLQQRNRAKLQKERFISARKVIEMEENEKGKIARELHDLTGQLVMGISGAIENIEFSEPEIKDQIKDRVADLGKSIRQISHRMNRAMIEHFTFSELITGLCEDVQKLSGMSVRLEIPEEFPDLANELVLHFYRITQELLTNATKYAGDSQVNIRIMTQDGKLALFYSDNGPGFTPGEKNKKSSMGIMNIFERVKLIRGQAFINSSPGKGTSWEIFFPIYQKDTIKS
jgi:two-component system, NarL family, sensor kinase